MENSMKKTFGEDFISESDITERKNVTRVSPDPAFGLTYEQLKERMSAGLVNTAVKGGTKSISAIILNNLLTFYNFLFVIIAIALIIERSYNNLTFLGVVITNVIIGIVQEINSKIKLDKLNLLSMPKITVIRGGREAVVSCEDLVIDDVVIFTTGQQICADAVLLSGELQVNESLVTGESDEISKRAGDELLSGSFVVSGKCYARLDKVGAEAFAAKLTLDAKKTKKKQQPGMMRSLTILVRVIGIVIIPLGVIMFINHTRHLGMDTKLAVESTAAALIGMIPEGLYLLTSIALAASVIRLAQKKIVVHELKCIEALARVDVLCVDKTGTITEDKMDFRGIFSLGREYCQEYADSVLCDFALSMNEDNSTMATIRKHYVDLVRSLSLDPQKVIGFSSVTKYSAVLFGENNGYILGAPEFVLKQYYTDEIRAEVEKHSSLGERVLLLGSYNCREDRDDNIFSGGNFDPVNVAPIAIVTLINRIRPNARETFEYFAEQGVTIKVISGDNPLTASEAARQAGIVGAEKYIDASTLDTKEKIEKAILEYTVFGRVTPDQKRMFIRALKKAGHTVAMTGDGVNDVLALKDADCSIAMASGSEAACNVSDLVLLNSDFSAMPAVVAEGRRVINNIERSAALFLVKNIFSFIMAVAALFIPFVYPFTPAQLSLVNAIMIGIPSFFLALAPNKNKVTGRFLANVMYRALPLALTNVFVITGVLLFAYAFDIPYTQTSTVSLILFAAVGWVMLYRVCKPFNLRKWILWGGMGILFVISLFVLGSFFSIYPLSFADILIMTVFLLLVYPSVKAITLSLDKISGFYEKLKAKIFELGRKNLKNE